MENAGEREFALEFLQEKKDLGTDGNVVGGYWFVGNDDTGLKNKGASDADAPSLAARKLVRVTAQGVFVEAGGSRRRALCLERPRSRMGSGSATISPLHAGIERGERILKNDRHAAPLGTPFSAAKNEEIAVLELNGTGVGARSGR